MPLITRNNRFSCNKDLDIEFFLKNKALLFQKKGLLHFLIAHIKNSAIAHRAFLLYNILMNSKTPSLKNIFSSFFFEYWEQIKFVFTQLIKFYKKLASLKFNFYF